MSILKFIPKTKKLPLDIYKNSLVLGFSYYRLLSSYKGYCVRVRRSSDNAELDFGFVRNYIDIDGILAFCGAGSGYVSIWYNQYSLGNNAIQASSGSQPRIVNAGTFEGNGLNFINTNANWLTISDYNAANILTPPFSIYLNYILTIHTGYVFARSTGGTHQYSISPQIGSSIVANFIQAYVANINDAVGYNKYLYRWIDTNPNGLTFTVNGLISTNTYGISPLTARNSLAIGARDPGAAFTNGNIKTVLLFNHNVDYNIVSKV